MSGLIWTVFGSVERATFFSEIVSVTTITHSAFGYGWCIASHSAFDIATLLVWVVTPRDWSTEVDVGVAPKAGVAPVTSSVASRAIDMPVFIAKLLRIMFPPIGLVLHQSERHSLRLTPTSTLSRACSFVKEHATAGASESIRAVHYRGLGKDHLQFAGAGHSPYLSIDHPQSGQMGRHVDARLSTPLLGGHTFTRIVSARLLIGRRLRHLDQHPSSRHDRVCQLESVGLTPHEPTKPRLIAPNATLLDGNGRVPKDARSGSSSQGTRNPARHDYLSGGTRRFKSSRPDQRTGPGERGLVLWT